MGDFRNLDKYDDVPIPVGDGRGGVVGEITMSEFVPGNRYPMTAADAADVMRQGWPAVSGEPDVSRGRRFLKPPGDWIFWTTDGRRIHFSYSGFGLIVSQSREPDPDRPGPLKEGG